MSEPKIIKDKEIEFEGQDLHEFLRSDIERWIETNKVAHGNKTSVESLLHYLADKLNVSERQIRRYLEGSTEISVKKVISICKKIGLKGIFEYANYQIGLGSYEFPDIPISECDNYDAAEELVKNIKTFSAQANVLAKSLNEKPSLEMLQKIKTTSLTAIKQILKCERFYAEMLKQKALAEYKRREDTRQKREQKHRKALEKAGQGRLL